MAKKTIVAMAFAILSERTEAQPSGDACALLKPAELQGLAGTAALGPGKAGTEALDTRTCRYEWGTGGNVQSGKSFLNVVVTPTSKAFPGMDPAMVQMGLLANAKAGKPDTAVVPGIGDAAVFESNDPIRAKATALARGNMLVVTFESSDARAKKEQVIALLKAAAGRL
jgi:hypothetical protein